MSDPTTNYPGQRGERVRRPSPWASALGGERPLLSCRDVRAGFGRWTKWPLRRFETPAARRRAAVLVPLFDDGDGRCRVLMIERAHHRGLHRGELAFPGGGADEGESAIQTALRESHEELGIDPGSVDVLGTVVTHNTATGYDMEVIAGILAGRPMLHPNPDEVARTVEFPLDELLTPGAFWEEHWGEDRHVIPFFSHGRDTAFGVTAGVLMMVLDAAVAGFEERERR